MPSAEDRLRYVYHTVSDYFFRYWKQEEGSGTAYLLKNIEGGGDSYWAVAPKAERALATRLKSWSAHNQNTVSIAQEGEIRDDMGASLGPVLEAEDRNPYLG